MLVINNWHWEYNKTMKNYHRIYQHHLSQILVGTILKSFLWKSVSRRHTSVLQLLQPMNDLRWVSFLFEIELLPIGVCIKNFRKKEKLTKC